MMKWDEENDGYGDGDAWMRGPLLGKGSYGRVHKAISKRPLTMAVKSAKLSQSATLQNEKEILTKVSGSPYVIRCFGDETTVGEGGVKGYNLLLEYASGGTLSDRIKKWGGKGGMPEYEIRAHTRSILEGVDHIHIQGYVHCDLKPENILLVPTNGEETQFTAKISDFGLAKLRKGHHREKKRRLMEERYYWRGTPMYLSPEAVIRNEQESDSDIWAVGCVVLNMLTGKPVWEGMNTDEVLAKIGTDQELPRIPDSISGEARGFLMSCFERNPDLRMTADLLLEHPFLNKDHCNYNCNCNCSGDDDDDVVELVQVSSGSEKSECN